MSTIALKTSDMNMSMTQVVPPEILDVMRLRTDIRVGGSYVSFPDSVVAAIAQIRDDIPSGEDLGGWSKAGGRNIRAAQGPARMPTGGERRAQAGESGAHGGRGGERGGGERGGPHGGFRGGERSGGERRAQAGESGERSGGERSGGERSGERSGVERQPAGQRPQGGGAGGGNNTRTMNFGAVSDSSHAWADKRGGDRSTANHQGHPKSSFSSAGASAAAAAAAAGGKYKFTNSSVAAPAPVPAPVAAAAPAPVAMPASAPAAAATAAVTPAKTTQPAPYKKWVSPFKKQDESFESVIVSTVINDKLNKFSPVNYTDIHDFLSEILAAGDTDFLHDFMRLVFQKAATESTYCPLYARLLRDLSAKYPFLIDEMRVLFNKFLDIFKEVTEEECTDMEEFIKRNKEKRYRKGYSQFLAELFKLGIVDSTAYIQTLDRIIAEMNTLSTQRDKTQIIDEYTACITHMLQIINSDGADAGSAAAPTTDIYDRISELAAARLKPLTVASADRPSLSPKIRFMIMNAIEDIC